MRPLFEGSAHLKSWKRQRNISFQVNVIFLSIRKCLFIIPIHLFWHFLIALPVASSLNFDLTVPFHAVLELHCSSMEIPARISAVVGLRRLLTFSDSNVALIRVNTVRQIKSEKCLTGSLTS